MQLAPDVQTTSLHYLRIEVWGSPLVGLFILNNKDIKFGAFWMPATWSWCYTVTQRKSKCFNSHKTQQLPPSRIHVHHSSTGILCSFWGKTCNCPSVAVFHIIGASLSEPNTNGNRWIVVRPSHNRKSTKKHGNFTIMCTIELYNHNVNELVCEHGALCNVWECVIKWWRKTRQAKKNKGLRREQEAPEEKMLGFRKHTSMLLLRTWEKEAFKSKRNWWASTWLI